MKARTPKLTFAENDDIEFDSHLSYLENTRTQANLNRETHHLAKFSNPSSTIANLITASHKMEQPSSWFKLKRELSLSPEQVHENLTQPVKLENEESPEGMGKRRMVPSPSPQEKGNANKIKDLAMGEQDIEVVRRNMDELLTDRVISDMQFADLHYPDGNKAVGEIVARDLTDQKPIYIASKNHGHMRKPTANHFERDLLEQRENGIGFAVRNEEIQPPGRNAEDWRRDLENGRREYDELFKRTLFDLIGEGPDCEYCRKYKPAFTMGRPGRWTVVGCVGLHQDELLGNVQAALTMTTRENVEGLIRDENDREKMAEEAANKCDTMAMFDMDGMDASG